MGWTATTKAAAAGGYATVVIVVIAEKENKQMRVMIVSPDSFHLLAIFGICCCFRLNETKKKYDNFATAQNGIVDAAAKPDTNYVYILSICLCRRHLEQHQFLVDFDELL